MIEHIPPRSALPQTHTSECIASFCHCGSCIPTVVEFLVSSSLPQSLSPAPLLVDSAGSAHSVMTVLGMFPWKVSFLSIESCAPLLLHLEEMEAELQSIFCVPHHTFSPRSCSLLFTLPMAQECPSATLVLAEYLSQKFFYFIFLK